MDSSDSGIRRFFLGLFKKGSTSTKVCFPSIPDTVPAEVFREILLTLYAVEAEFKEHDDDYHHKTSPKVKEAVRSAILRLGGFLKVRSL